MIIDQLANAPLYFGLGARFARAFEYLLQTDFNALAPGRYEIQGTDVFALVQAYDTKPRAQGFWEAHRKYSDVQYVVSGVEQMGFTSLAHLQAGDYDAAKDFVPAQGAVEVVTVRAGSFALFMPQDAHIPGLALDVPQAVKKVVVKVAV